MVTGFVVIVKFAWEEPDRIFTDAGIVTLELEDAKLTVMPVAGAFPDNVTVPVAVRPPSTLVGEIDKPVNVAGLMVNADVLVIP